jgi:tetratricopeptide (TPR) repeat protein
MPNWLFWLCVSLVGVISLALLAWLGLKLKNTQQHNSVQRLYDAGVDCFASNKPSQALAYFQKAYVLKATHGPTVYNLGVVNLALNQTQEALRFFKEALALNPEDSGALYN